MPVVTVAGASGQTVSLSFSSSENYLLATKIAGAISAGVKNSQLIPASSKNGAPPNLAPGVDGEWVQQTSGVTFLPHGYKAVVNDSKGSIIFGSGDLGESVLSGAGGMTFIATGGSGTVVAAGGSNTVLVPPNDSGSWLISTGAGNDSIIALGTGNDTIQAGSGNNLILLGGGKDMVTLTGSDTVYGGSGADTIDATQAKSAIVQGGSTACIANIDHS